MAQCACRAVGFLLALLLGATQVAAMAVPSLALQPGGGLPPPADRDLATIPYLAPERATSAVPTAVAATGALPDSKLAFQSLRDGNWEIYVADAAGSNPTRVTSRGASDVQPRLNRGCTRIVFASNASGNYEIATINPDGTGLLRLTMHEASDTQPAWSPDGMRIAFQSNRDGQSEIYVMDADGSSPTRLTSHAAYDGYPAWSPDGTRIAFSSNRSGIQAIWVMNADGSNPVQLSSQPSSVYPTWSPDGSRLAYSADQNGDQFLELWLMAADGSDQRLRYDQGSRAMDAWARSWSADGRYVSFTRLHLVLYNGVWYWDEAVLLANDTWVVWSDTPLELATGGRDWHPDWQALDAVAPVSTLDTLPMVSRSWRVPVSWSASDEGVGPAGVLDFEVQVQADDGSWTDWLVHTPATRDLFAGVAGQQVRFRIRGRDAVYNVGAWTADDAAPGTRLFSFYLSGRVHDVRGVGLSGAGVAIDPPPVTQTGVDAQGLFEARLAQPGSTQLSAQAAGFASPPSALGSVGYDLEAGVCLPPLEDGVSNGGFEAGGGSLAGWETAGTYSPAATVAARHTGQAGAWLGPNLEPQLSPAQAVSGGLYSDPQLVTSPDGTLHMLYEGHVVGENYGEPHYTYRNLDGTWSVPEPVGNDGIYGYSRTPALALGGDGRLHAVWVGEAGIYYNHTREDGTWTGQELIGPGGQSPALAVDSSDGLHVVYTTYINIDQVTLMYETVRPSGGTWSAPALLGNGHDPVLAPGRDGVVHLMWAERGDPRTANYRQWTAEGQWEAEEVVGYCGYYGLHTLVEDAFGQLHALWTTDWPNSLYAVRSLDGIWSTPQVLDAVQTYADLSTDSTGTVYLTYNGVWSGIEGTYHAFRRPGQDWSEPVFMDVAHADNAIAIDAADNPHVVYETWDGNRYRTGALAQKDASSTLSQTITIPPAQNRPTLSFFYRLQGVLPAHEGGLRVTIDDGATSTLVLTTTTSGDWTHAWAPLEAWAGRTVNLTLAADSVAGEPYARLALDEVAAGSWLTPVPVAVTPGHVPAGAPAAITVSGQNFHPGAIVWLGGAPLAGTQWVGDTTLTATVPRDQVPGRQPLWVVNPGGARGPTIWLRVGQAAFLPVILH